MAAPSEEEGEEKAEGESAAPKKGKKKLLLILIPVIVLLIGGGAAFMLLGGSEDKHAEEEEEPPRTYATLKLDPFIVNLAESTAYVKVTLVVEYDVDLVAAGALGGGGGGGGHGGGGAGGGDAPAGPPPLFASREPMIRDAVIRVLSSKKKEEVLTQAGKEQLKEELLDAMNEALGLEEAAIISVYFLEFIIQ